MSVRVIDNMAKFRTRHNQSVDMVLNTMAVDIERLAKMVVPKDKGQLQSSIHHQRMGFTRYAIIANKEYAAYQHEGKRRDGSHVVRHYSKAGTGKEYLSGPGKIIGRSFPRRLVAIVNRMTLTSMNVDLGLGNFGN